MLKVRQQIGGLGNLMFKQAYLWSQFRKAEIPDLYVQSEKFFEDYSEEIKQIYGDNIGYIDSVSIHIRRGDYLEKGNFYVDLTKTDYYKKAIAMFPDDKFLVFYRDRQDKNIDQKDENYVREFLDKLIPGRYKIWNGGEDETDDLNAMASCKSNIMANSSFSWWAAYLNPNPHKEVICPEKWFGDGVQRCDLLES